jgi:hypothetical protein
METHDKRSVGVQSMRLPFAELALSHFAFLEDTLQLHLVCTDEHFVCWEGRGVFVRLYYDATNSHELDLLIGQVNVPDCDRETAFDIGEVARSAGIEWSRGAFQASTFDRLYAGLEKFGALLRDPRLQPALNCDPDAFELAELQRLREQYADSQIEEQRQFQEEIDAAWRKDDFTRVIELCQNHTQPLSAVDTKRFQIASRRIGEH